MHAIKNMSKSKQLLYKNSFVSKLPRNHKILWSIQGSRTCLIFAVDQLVIGYEHWDVERLDMCIQELREGQMTYNT